MNAPWNFKICFAFISDCVPICGQRRKPYLFVGATVQGLGWLLLGVLPASIGALAVISFVVTLGQVEVGTMVDAIIVENMKNEREAEKGKLLVIVAIYNMSYPYTLI